MSINRQKKKDENCISFPDCLCNWVIVARSLWGRLLMKKLQGDLDVCMLESVYWRLKHQFESMCDWPPSPVHNSWRVRTTAAQMPTVKEEDTNVRDTVNPYGHRVCDLSPPSQRNDLRSTLTTAQSLASRRLALLCQKLKLFRKHFPEPVRGLGYIWEAEENLSCCV